MAGSGSQADQHLPAPVYKKPRIYNPQEKMWVYSISGHFVYAQESPFQAISDAR